jgi:murein DD-endopeptidase MepM/ murein hydrolase activator NlpD
MTVGAFEMAVTLQNITRFSAVSLTALLISGCQLGSLNDFDLDFRNNNFDTSEAVNQALKNRPQPDSRGVISYPTYQVVVAKRGETVGSIATRLNQNPAALAEYNGLKVDERLRDGAIVALPSRIASSGPQPNDPATAPTSGAPNSGTIDVTSLAQSAIDQAPQSPSAAWKKPVPSDPKIEPVRHKVVRGESAFTISRLYNVSVRSLAEWNSLDANFTIREGQILLVPLAEGQAAPKPAPEPISAPGVSSPTPVPPSASTPLPTATPVPTPTAQPAQSAPKPVATPSGARLAYPVKGKIIREYVKGKTDGIDISAPAGTSIVAAEAGTVAAITADANQVPIIVIKHADNLLTVYANVGNIAVSKGSSVKRGAVLGKVRDGNPTYVHFEVRQGFESVDPMQYLTK